MRVDPFGNEFIDKYYPCYMTSDLNLTNCGKRIRSINHVYHYMPRNMFVMSLITEGKARLTSSERSYHVSEGTLMIFFPNSPEIHYRSDPDTPFSVSWIGVFGSVVMNILKQLNITREEPFIQVSEPERLSGIMDEIMNHDDCASGYASLFRIAKTYEFFSILSKEIQHHDKKNYVEQAIEYMNANFVRGITSGDVVKHVGLDKSYFAMLFKKSVSVSPSVHLKNIRIRRALDMLHNTDMSIAEIANAVGISDEHYFSRMFSSVIGDSPSNYRKQYRKDNEK